MTIPQPHPDVVNRHPPVLIVGYGHVGQQMAKFFTEAHYVDIDGVIHPQDETGDVLGKYALGFICVPTPEGKDGRCDTSVVREAYKRWEHKARYWCIKSTVEVGTTERLGKNVCFSPEYYGETLGHPLRDSMPFIILGGPPEVTRAFAEAWTLVTNAYTCIYQTDARTAELCKLMENAWLATKVSFCNQFYDLAETAGVDWYELRELWLADPRINRSHTYVYPGNRGWGGKCLVPETRVRTPDGDIDLDTIEIGDVVLDEHGPTVVTAKAERSVESLVAVTARGRRLIGSADHRQIVGRFDGLFEKPLGEVTTDDWLFIPRPTPGSLRVVTLGPAPNGYCRWWPDQIELTPELARMLGLYLAEGCSSNEEVIWSFGLEEERLADEVHGVLSGLGLNPYKRLQVSNGTFGCSECWIVRVRSKGFVRMIDCLGLGHNALDKGCPMLPLDLAAPLVGGWLEGDGCQYQGTISGHSESRRLIASMDALLLSLGVNASIKKGGKEVRISMRDDVERVARWVCRFEYNASRYVRPNSYASPNMRLIDDGWLVRVSAIKRVSGGRVVAIETGSGRYVANTILTHNCLPKDTANLCAWARSLGHPADLIEAVRTYNARQRGR